MIERLVFRANGADVHGSDAANLDIAGPFLRVGAHSHCDARLRRRIDPYPRIRDTPESFGMPAWRCESIEDYREALKKGIAADRPSLSCFPSTTRSTWRSPKNSEGRQWRHEHGYSGGAQASSRASPSSSSSAASGATAPEGRRSTVEDPATGETDRRGRRRARPTTPWPRSTPPSSAQADGPPRRPRARRDPAPRLRADHRARRRPRAADDARDGQAAGRVEGRDHLRRRVLPLVLRGGGAHRRPLPAAPQRRGPPAHDAPAGRAVPAASRPGTSRWRWAPARSARPSPPAARWS